MDIQLPGPNLSLQQATNYQLIIEGIPNVLYNLQRLDIPSMNLSPAVFPVSPLIGDLQYPGDKITYDPLSCAALLDEDLTGYREIRNWMLDCAKGKKRLLDATVIVLSNKLNLTQSTKYIGCWPSSLGVISYDYSQGPDSPLYYDITLMFQYYKFSDEVI